MDDLTSGKPIDFITSDQPRRRRYPDWQQAAEGEHALLVDAEAQLAAATAENARLRGLLGEFVAENDETGYLAILYWSVGCMEYLCPFCSGGRNHTPDCLVLRARTELTADTSD